MHCNSSRQWKPGSCRINLLSMIRLFAVLGFLCTTAGKCADLAETRKLLISGDLIKAASQAEEALKAGGGEEDWSLILVQTHMLAGRYTNAWTAIQPALEQHPFSLRLRLLAREVALFNTNRTRADELLEEVGLLANRRPWAYRDPTSIVAIGQVAMLLGMDPKQVLENTFDRAKKLDPSNRDAHMASTDVALSKNDFDLASKLASEALKKFPKDPDFHGRLARAYFEGNRKAMLEEIQSALDINENHIPSRLLLAEHLIDAEQDEEAEKQLMQVLETNPNQPEAWALRAVLAHLRNEQSSEEKHRARALQFYRDNPMVDHLIGAKLSRKYRFAEGAERQRQALKFDPKFAPARSQLAQDLLRLGQDAEGWEMVERAHEEDGYDVAAYNLASLKDSLGKFATLTNSHFLVRMNTNEAVIYGDRVLSLLNRARSKLVEKYGVKLQEPTLVEIFDDQKDFAVRTFGTPGGAGYLGVCFGRVITANSPATQSGKAASWESVLWHEFAHVVTLQMTRNKMPRWLSEGISVYEELEENPAWGQQMTPRYREMILGDELSKISELSGAFLAPPSGEHMMFAYYQSYLAVRFLTERQGLESLKKILKELAAGASVNDAIARNTVALDTLETEFEDFAKKMARELAPALEWEKPEREDLSPRGKEPAEWALKHPKNFYALMHQARHFVKARDWEKARAPLEELVRSFPLQTDPGNAHEMLAQVYRELKLPKEERRLLDKYASVDSNALDAYSRLMELATADKDWLVVMENVQRALAVNPLAHGAYAHWAKAAEAAGKPSEAINALRILLRLDPPDPAGAHYDLGRLLFASNDPGAKQHVLEALEEAPRFRDAHSLLRKIHESSKKSN
ncbi:MAG: tetratricopeptide repeat protein [Verrucomicrobia bacterium]|nr:tetratricopeptide repeat protein [Verrucomicrobiota bacterium]